MVPEWDNLDYWLIREIFGISPCLLFCYLACKMFDKGRQNIIDVSVLSFILRIAFLTVKSSFITDMIGRKVWEKEKLFTPLRNDKNNNIIIISHIWDLQLRTVLHVCINNVPIMWSVADVKN